MCFKRHNSIIKKANSPIKMGKGQFSKDTQEASKHMEGCSATLAVGEVQITTTSYHFTPTRMVLMKKADNNMCWCIYRDIGAHIHCS